MIWGGLPALKRLFSRRRAEHQRNRLSTIAANEHGQRTIDASTGGVAHNLNNIIAAIAGFNAVIEMNADNDGVVAQSAKDISVSVKRAKRLVNDMFHPDWGFVPSFCDLDVADLLEDTISILSVTLPTSVRLEYSRSNERQRISADFDQVQQVLLNICNNAAQAMPAGGSIHIDTRTVTLSEPLQTSHMLTGPGLYVTIGIRDEGIGMSSTVAARIFEPFFTTRNGGAGLGLSTARDIVERHRGAIDVRSWPGEGTKFELWIPVDCALSPPTAEAASVSDGKIVLIVNADSAQLAHDEGLIAELGYEPAALSDLATLPDFEGRVDILLVAGDRDEQIMMALDAIHAAGWTSPLLVAARRPSTITPKPPLHYPLLRTELGLLLAEAAELIEQAKTDVSDASRRSSTGGVLATHAGPLPGTVLNGVHRIERVVTRSGLGTVHLGVNVHTGSRIAITIIAPQIAADPDMPAALHSSMRAYSVVDHPAVLPYQGIVHDRALDVHYAFTDAFTGDLLADRVRTTKASVHDTLALLRRLATGLRAVHDTDALHADVSPYNVVLPPGRPDLARIIDFGLSKDIHCGPVGGFAKSAFGTSGYAAPEQLGVTTWPIGQWTDVYGLALVTLSFATGREAEGTNLPDGLTGRATLPTLDEAPVPLRSLLHDMLVPDPAQRILSMDAVLAALDELEERLSSVDGPASTALVSKRAVQILANSSILMPHQRSSVRALALMSLSIALLGTVVVIYSSPRSPTRVMEHMASARHEYSKRTTKIEMAREPEPLLPSQQVTQADASTVAAAPSRQYRLATLHHPQDHSVVGRHATGALTIRHAEHARFAQPRLDRYVNRASPIQLAASIGSRQPIVCRRYVASGWKTIGTIAASDCIQRAYSKHKVIFVQIGGSIFTLSKGWIFEYRSGTQRALRSAVLWSTASARPQRLSTVLALGYASACRRFDGASWRMMGTFTTRRCVELAFAQPGTSYVQSDRLVLSRHADRIGLVQGTVWRAIAKVNDHRAPGSSIALSIL